MEITQGAERLAAEALEAAEQALQAWQQHWEEFNRDFGAAHQTTRWSARASSSWRTSCAG